MAALAGRHPCTTEENPPSMRRRDAVTRKVPFARALPGVMRWSQGPILWATIR